MVKLVDTYVSGAYAVRCAGSSPVPGTRKNKSLRWEAFLLIIRAENGPDAAGLNLCLHYPPMSRHGRHDLSLSSKYEEPGMRFELTTC
jgi:hypothetical protein